MTYSPPVVGVPDPMVLSVMTDDISQHMAFVGQSGASSGILATNGAVFLPVRISQTRTYVAAWWLNGVSVAGNIDVGVYTLSGTTLTRVVASVAEAQAGVSAMQVAASFAATTLTPGVYYLGISTSSTSSAFYRASLGTVGMSRMVGAVSAVAASPLPATATAVTCTVTAVPTFGLAEVAP